MTKPRFAPGDDIFFISGTVQKSTVAGMINLTLVVDSTNKANVLTTLGNYSLDDAFAEIDESETNGVWQYVTASGVLVDDSVVGQTLSSAVQRYTDYLTTSYMAREAAGR
jgi:hypothetical protein